MPDPTLAPADDARAQLAVMYRVDAPGCPEVRPDHQDKDGWWACWTEPGMCERIEGDDLRYVKMCAFHERIRRLREQRIAFWEKSEQARIEAEEEKARMVKWSKEQAGSR